MRPSVDIVLRLPKHVKLDSVNVGSLKLDENWPVTVFENHQRIDELPLKVARRKYA